MLPVCAILFASGHALFHCLNCMFCLTIRLGVIWWTGDVLEVPLLAEMFELRAVKWWSIVSYQDLWSTFCREYVSEYVDSAFSSCSPHLLYEDIFAEVINYQEKFLSFKLKEVCSYLLPGSIWHFMGKEWFPGVVWFCYKTGMAVIDKVLYVCIDSWPVYSCFGNLLHCNGSLMSATWRLVSVFSHWLLGMTMWCPFSRIPWSPSCHHVHICRCCVV